MRKFHLSALSFLAALVFVTGCGDDKAAGPVEAPAQNQKEVVDLDAKTLAPALRAIAWDVSDAEKHGLIITNAISETLIKADAQISEEDSKHFAEHVAALTATRDALNLKLVASNGDTDSIAALTEELKNFRKEADEFEAWAAGLSGNAGPPAFAVLFDLHSRRDAARSAGIAGLRSGGDEFVRFSRRHGDEAVGEWGEFCGRAGGARGDRLFICLPAAASASVDPYGRLQYCLGLRHPAAVYDLAAGSLREAVTEFLPRLRETRAADPAYLERCARCFLRGLCAQCPAKSWAEHGTLDTPVEYFCGIAHAQAIAAGLLGPGEKAWDVRDGAERAKRRRNGS